MLLIPLSKILQYSLRHSLWTVMTRVGESIDIKALGFNPRHEPVEHKEVRVLVCRYVSVLFRHALDHLILQSRMCTQLHPSILHVVCLRPLGWNQLLSFTRGSGSYHPPSPLVQTSLSQCEARQDRKW